MACFVPTIALRASPFIEGATGRCVRRAQPRMAMRSVPAVALQMNAGGGGESGAPLVPILMGSASDTAHCEKIATALARLGVASEMRIASAHKVPHRLLEVVDEYERNGRPKVYIAVAGRSNALSGVLDCAVSAPVVSCPPYSDSFAGADLFSSIRMPGGVAPALVLDPAGAALYAAKCLGVYDPAIRAKVEALQAANRYRLAADDAALRAKSYLPSIGGVRQAGTALRATDERMVLGGALSGKRFEGKVRDRYEFDAADGTPLVALVTTDRQSAFDRVLAAVPYKGAVLNLVSAWWFERTRHIVANHVVSVPHPNVTVAKRCKPFPVEFVVRAYITGSTKTSLWRNYSEGRRTYCGLSLPEGLRKNQRLDAAVLTPTTKEDAGDRPIAPAEVVSEGLMSQADWDACARAAMALFRHGQQAALANGLILVDTKYEFGKDADGTITLIDELHTPDSSRYWLAASYEQRFDSGKEPENVDKEFLRLWFVEHCNPYDKNVALPEAPDDLVDQLAMKYVMLYELITGQRFNFESYGADRIAPAVAGAVQTAAADVVRA